MAFDTNNLGGFRRGGKSPGAFRTISEVSEDLEVPPHVLRFWETKFSQVKPLKRGGGRRYYRPEDVSLLKQIRELLYSDGYTIKGVQRLLKDGTHKASAGKSDNKTISTEVSEVRNSSEPSEGYRSEIQEVISELRLMRKRLSSLTDR
ncbi:MAG: transcriptional regulator [Rhodospirillaceae bacterium]|nr:transcriptional regulator [Rhodospirillaceae bacterium]